MKRPLLPVALLYAGGIAAGQWFHPPLALLFAASLAAGAAALCLTKWRWPLLSTLLVLAGWTNLNCHTQVISPNDLRAILGEQPADVKLRGVICAPPSPRIFERGAKELWHTTAFVNAGEIFRDGHWQPAFGKLIVTAPGVLGSNFFNGQTVEVAGIIHPLKGAVADGLFDPKLFYSGQGIYYQLQTDSGADWQATGSSGNLPLAERFSTWARQTLALGLDSEDESLRLMWTLALDWKAPLTESVEDPFMRAGTFHIFAVDGLRIGLLAGIFIALLRLLQIPRAACGLLVIPVIWFYAGLTGWPASAVRAAIMMSIVIGGWAANRPVDLLNSLFAAAAVILVWEPRQLFQPGFQLSFLIVLCIAMLVLPMRRALNAKFLAPDPFLPADLRPTWRIRLDDFRRWTVDVFSMSLAAWLGTIPLAAYYFHLFTPVSVPANFVVVPLTGLALMSCMGSLLTGAWFPGLAALFNNTAWFWMKCIIVVSQWNANWPHGNWFVASPRPLTFVLYYLVFMTVFTGWIFKSRHKRLAFVALAATAALWAVDWNIQRDTTRIDILALKGAPATFSRGPGMNGDVLFDCGDTAPAESIVKPFLHAQGVNRLDNFCLTTGHQQSVGGAEVILTNFSVSSVFASPAHVRSAAYRDLASMLAQKPGGWRVLQAGDHLEDWNVLYPQAEDKFTQADDLALVLQKTAGGHSVLLLSTLGRDGQNLLMNRHPDLRADIVVAGMPARDEPLCEPLLDMVQPKLVIIADSESPATRRATAKLKERLARRDGVRVLYCHDTGSLTLEIRSGGWEIRDVEGNDPKFVNYKFADSDPIPDQRN